jgi:hypothetical protein
MTNVVEPMVPPRAPSFRVAHEAVAIGLSAGKAGVRPHRVVHSSFNLDRGTAP